MKRVARGEAGRGSEGGKHTHVPQLVKKTQLSYCQWVEQSTDSVIAKGHTYRNVSTGGAVMRYL